LSSQRTTTHQNPNPPSREPDLGALVQHYSRVSPASNRVIRIARRMSRGPPRFQAAGDPASISLGFGRTAAADRSARSPVSLPARRTLQAGPGSAKSPPCDAAHRRAAAGNHPPLRAPNRT